MVHLVMLPPWFWFSVVLVVMMMRNVPGVQSKRGSPGHDSSLCLSSVAFLLRSCLELFLLSLVFGIMLMRNVPGVKYKKAKER